MNQNNNMSQQTGMVHSLESFGLVDGPGVRFVVFLQGCHMRCQYCHNPETWSMQGGEKWTAEDLFSHVSRYQRYWRDNGGITVSGGEPLLQMDFVTEFFRFAKEKGIHTTLDTSGNTFSLDEDYQERFRRLMDVTDLVMLDIKAMDGALHKKLTGQANEPILQLAHWLSDHGKDMWLRRVLVPGLTDSEEELIGLRDLAREMKTLKRLEVLPYHTLGLFKWEKLGVKYPLEGVPTPTAEDVARAEKILEVEKYNNK